MRASAIDKTALREALIGVLERELDSMRSAHRLTTEGVTHEDGRAEGSKDMRSTEASYIARGQAMRAEALDADLTRVRALSVRAFASGDAVALSALVDLVDGKGARQTVFLAPAGGGTRLQTVAGEVQVVTPQSPIGRALVGVHEGDVVEVARAGATVELEVDELA